MATGRASDDELIDQAVLRLNAFATALGLGLLAGVGLFVATLWLVIRGGQYVGQHLGLLSQYLPGYSVSFVGAFVGFAYAFVLAGASGYLLSIVYNRVAR